jgi:sugar lactone lactonase YvrE
MTRVLLPDLRKVVDQHDPVGETPVWSSALDGLYWANCEDPPRLQFWEASTGKCQTWPFAQRLGGYVLKRSGGALLALADGLYDLDLRTHALSKRVANDMSDASLHECRCDSHGRFWVGAIDRRVGPGNLQPEGGSFFRLEGARLVRVLTGISCSNGLAFSPDGTILYHSDAPTKIVYAWTVDPATGALSDQREFVRLAAEDGFCDGATVDAEGGYWMALVFAGKIRRYHPDGSLDLEIHLPFSNPTNIAFGGPKGSTLYVTTTCLSIGTPLKGEQLHGAVYSFEAGYRGLPEPLLQE